MDMAEVRNALDRLQASVTSIQTNYQNVTRESISQNVVVLGGIGFAINEGFPPLLIIAGCAGMAMLCVNWANQIRDYSFALRVKYQLVYDLENELSVQPLQKEWTVAPRRSLRFERSLPLLFGLAYVMLIVMIVPWPSAIPKPDWWPLFSLETFAR